MLFGKSTLHVNQNLGKHFSPGLLEGYFNNLIEKVTKEPKWLESDLVPTIKSEKGDEILFPVAVFQYGLGCYDLYLEHKDIKFLNKFLFLAEWALSSQSDDGSWKNFEYFFPSTPFSAMCQGEGTSLLLRAYFESKKDIYLEASKKAIDFMLRSIDDGGTTKYIGEDIFFYEYTHRPLVLNGWIFAFFGLYDYVLVTNDCHYREVLDRAIATLAKRIRSFDIGYWTKYNDQKLIASPFYHNLHIYQTYALYLVTGESVFRDCYIKWKKYKRNWLCYMRAFFKKAFQKTIERDN